MDEFIIFNENISTEELNSLNIHVSKDSKIANGAKLFSNCCVTQNSKICVNGEIHSNSVIINSVIGENASVFSSRVTDSFINKGAQIGPFARIDNSKIGEKCSVGNFVEISNSNISNNVKLKSLCVIKNCDIESGAVFDSGSVRLNEAGEKIKVN